MDLLLAQIKQEADYFPRMLFTLGNHEERLKRVAKDNPEMSGFDETAYLLSTPKNAKRLMDSVTQLTKQPLNILVISDCQVKDGVDLSYLTAIGKYIASKKPDVVVNIGDFWDFPSLSSYDKGKLSFEGRRLKADIEIGNKGMDLLLAPIKQEADYCPHMIFTLGNHEERLKRVAKDNPEMSGFIDYHLLNLSAWEVHDFLKPVEVNGVWFTLFTILLTQCQVNLTLVQLRVFLRLLVSLLL